MNQSWAYGNTKAKDVYLLMKCFVLSFLSVAGLTFSWTRGLGKTLQVSFNIFIIPNQLTSTDDCTCVDINQ